MAQCARCGTESGSLYTLRPRRNGGRYRELVCGGCRTEAHKNTGPTAQWIAADNARWDRVFQRHVDPMYYAPMIPTLQSSFGAFASQMEVAYRG